jgi:hypothetical protein
LLMTVWRMGEIDAWVNLAPHHIGSSSDRPSGIVIWNM